MKKFLHNISTNWILLIIILQPILDILAYFSFNTKITLVSFIARSLILVFIVFYSFLLSLNKKKFILKLSPIFIFSILHIINSYRVGYLSIFNDIRYLILVVQFPIITICLIDYLKNHKEQISQVKYGFVINVLIIFISVLLSVFTNTYNMTYEGYGLTGWFTSANTQSMILAITCPIFIYYFNKNGGLFSYIISNLIVIFLLFFNGTRTCFVTLLFILLFMIYNSLWEKNRKMKIYKFIISSLLLVLIIFNYNFSNTFTRGKSVKENDEKIEESAKKELEKEENEKIDFKNLSKEDVIKLLNTSYYYRDLIEIFGTEKVYNEMKDKMSYSVLADNRVRKKVCAKLISEDSDLITRFVGFEFTKIGQYGLDLENDFTAIYYYYGYLGFALYILFILYFIYILFKKFVKDKKIIFNPEFVIICGTLGLVLLGSEFSGAFLRKPNANIYLALLLIIIYFNYNYKKDNTTNNKIKFLLLHLGYGGIESATINSANALSKNYDVELVSLYNLKNNQLEKINDKVKIKFLYDGEPNRKELYDAIKSKNVFKILKEGCRSAKILILKKVLIIKEIVNDSSSTFVSTRMDFSTLLSKYGSENQIKIAQEHLHHNGNKKYINTIKNKYQNIDYLFALTKCLKDDYEKFLKHNKHTKVVLVPNMLTENNAKVSNLKNKNIISVGRLHAGKKIDELITIFSKIKNKKSKFYIIGDGDEYKKLENQITSLKLTDRVFLLGYKDKEEIEKYLAESSVFVMASISEGLPMVLLEAMNSGVPCIAYETESGINDIITNNKDGYIIKNRSEKKFIEKLDLLLNDNKKLSELSKNSKIKANQFKEIEVMKIWEKVLCNKI